MGGFPRALGMLAAVATLVGCAAPSTESSSANPPSGSPRATAAPTPTPKPEYQAFEGLTVGDCFDPVEDREDRSLLAGIVRRCDEPHFMEVFAFQAAAGADSAPFPSVTDMDRQAEEICRTTFKVYVGIDYDDSNLGVSYYTPDEETWSMGDRRVLCAARASEIAPFTQSVRNSRA